MAETSLHFHPETGKPMPVSYQEFYNLDRHEVRAFLRAFSRKESKDFQLAVVAKALTLTRDERRKLEKAFVDKLEKRENKSVGDKVELYLARLRLKKVMLPEKKPIFFRKLRTGEPKVPVFLRNAKSPYLIS